jgi:glycosyltransferase involved in cell wall biosynthesis
MVDMTVLEQEAVLAPRTIAGSARILILVSFANLAGAQIAALRLARGLRDRGHDPRVVFFYELSPIETPDHPYEVLLPRANPGAGGYLRIWLELAKLLRSDRPEIVLTFLPLASVLGQATAFLSGVRRRVVSHRMPVNTASPPLRALDTIWAKLGIYTNVVAVSESVRTTSAHYPERLRAKTVVVHNGLLGWRPSGLTRTGARKRFRVADDAFLMVAVGRLVAQKNYPFMLRVMAELGDGMLLIAGEGPLRPELEAQIERLGLDARVRILGSVARDDIPDLLRAADLFLQTSTYEGQSNSVLEALQAGVPMVVHDIAEQRETIAEPDGSAAGALVPLEVVEAWVSAIRRLRDEPAAVAGARTVAARRARAFTYEAMVTGFEDVLTSRPAMAP